MVDEISDKLEGAATELPTTGLLAKSHVAQGEAIYYKPSESVESPEPDDAEDREAALEDAHSEITDSIDDKFNKREPTQLQGCFMPRNKHESTLYETCTNGHLGGILKWKLSKQASRDKEPTWVVTNICGCQTMVTGYYKSLDTHADIVEVMFAAPGNDSLVEWRPEYVPIEAIRTVEAFKKELIPKGLAVTAANIQEVIEYYDACLKANLGVSGTAFKRGFVNETTGWKILPGNSSTRIFVAGQRAYKTTSNGISEYDAVFTDNKNVGVQTMLEPRGSLKEWVTSIRDVICYPKVRFMCYYAMGTMLLEPLNAPGSTFGIVGDSSIGKTFTNMITASHIGNPDDSSGGLLFIGDASITGLSAVVTTFKDLPCFFDETTNMKEDVKKYLGYLIANGQEPLRGTKDAKARARSKIRANVMLTGETEFISELANNGANIRAIVLQSSPLPKLDPKVIRQARRGILKNYGHILEPFLQAIAEHTDELRDWYDEALDRLESTTEDVKLKRRASYFAVAEVAGRLLEPIYESLGLKSMKPEEIVDEMWNECVLNGHEEPLAIKALRSINDKLVSISNKNTLVNDAEPSTTNDIYAWSDSTNIDVLKNIVTEHLKKEGYANIGKTILAPLRTAGILETNNPTEYQKTAYHYTSKNNVRENILVLRFNKEKMNAALGKKDEWGATAASIKSTPTSWADAIAKCKTSN